MANIERIDLNDLHDLAESFTNLKVVDLKMNTTWGNNALVNPQVPPIYRKCGKYRY